MFVQADYELLLLNKENADYWFQNTNRCPQEIVEEIRANNIFNMPCLHYKEHL